MNKNYIDKILNYEEKNINNAILTEKPKTVRELDKLLKTKFGISVSFIDLNSKYYDKILKNEDYGLSSDHDIQLSRYHYTNDMLDGYHFRLIYCCLLFSFKCNYKENNKHNFYDWKINNIKVEIVSLEDYHLYRTYGSLNINDKCGDYDKLVLFGKNTYSIAYDVYNNNSSYVERTISPKLFKI